MSRMYINIDSDTVTDPFLNRVAEKENISEEMLYPFVDQYKGTSVTDLIFNNFCQYSVTKSKVWEDFEAKYNKEYENGIKVNYKDLRAFRAKIKMLKEFNIDFFKVWINRARESGFTTWLSVRMNDCHYPDDETMWIRDDFFYEARKNGWMIGERYGYFRNCYDYRFGQIRKRMLDYIDEQLNTYNVDGIELDFMREMTCFRYLEEDIKGCTEIMNGFMRDVKKMTQNAGERWNHDIKIMVRLSRNISDCLKMGFDVSEWIKDGSVDIIVPSPRWCSSDSGIDINAWKKFAEGVEVTACIETLLDCRKGVPCTVSPDVARGLTAMYLSKGSDGIYFYNYFTDPDARSGVAADNEYHSWSRNHMVYNTCGGFEKIFKNPVRYVVIPQKDDYPGMSECWSPVPAELGEAEFELVTGKIPAGKKVSLIVGVDDKEMEVTVNGVPCAKAQEIDLSYIPGIGAQPESYITDGVLYMWYEINFDALCEHKQIIKLKVDKKTTVSWVEIDVI